MNRASEGLPIPAFFRITLLDVLGGPLNQVEGPKVAFLVVIRPVNEAVLAKNNPVGFGMLLGDFLHFQAELEPRTQPGRVNDLITINLMSQLRGILRRSDRDGRIGMGMVNVL